MIQCGSNKRVCLCSSLRVGMHVCIRLSVCVCVCVSPLTGSYTCLYSITLSNWCRPQPMTYRLLDAWVGALEEVVCNMGRWFNATCTAFHSADFWQNQELHVGMMSGRWSLEPILTDHSS